MKRFFAPNVDRKGRIARGLMGLALLAAAAFSFATSVWLAGLLAAAGVFALIEAIRGSYLARACGLKIRPRSPGSQAAHCQIDVEVQARGSGAAERTASRHDSAPGEMGFPRLPTPRPCPPWLHGRDPLRGDYEDSDPDRPFRHRPWFPDSRHLDFRAFRLQPSAVLDQTRSTPSTRAALCCSGFALALAGSPEPPTESSSLCPGTRTALRTVRSL
jgi:hypothetical protein